MHIKHHPTSPPTPFIPQWTILTVLFNTQLNLMANSYSMRISFQISSLSRSKELSPQPRMAVAKVLLRGWKETRRSRDESKVKPRRETGLEGRYPEYLTTCVPGRSSESNKKPTKIYRYIYVFAHRFSGRICRKTTSITACNKYQSRDKLSPLSTSFIVVQVRI